MKTDAELYEHYLKVAKVGGKENAHKGLRAVYDAGRRAALEEAIAECQRGKERCANVTTTGEQAAIAWAIGGLQHKIDVIDFCDCGPDGMGPHEPGTDCASEK
jgi:hypothetical protein